MGRAAVVAAELGAGLIGLDAATHNKPTAAPTLQPSQARPSSTVLTLWEELHDRVTKARAMCSVLGRQDMPTDPAIPLVCWAAADLLAQAEDVLSDLAVSLNFRNLAAEAAEGGGAGVVGGAS